MKGKKHTIVEEYYDANSDEHSIYTEIDGESRFLNKEEQADFIKKGTEKTFVKDVTSEFTDTELKAEIDAKYDAEYIDAVRKGEMTKEQAIQALEEIGRKDSSAYAEIEALGVIKPKEVKLTQGQRHTILNNIFNNLLGKFVTDKVNKAKLAEEMRTILEESMSSLKQTDPALYEAIMKDKDRIIGLGKYKDAPFTLREAVQEHFNIENLKEMDEDFLDAEATNIKNHSKIAQEHDVRTSISSKLKRLFSGIPVIKKRGEPVGNIVEFMELDDVFSAVQDMLADSSNDFETLQFRIEEKIKLNPEEFGFFRSCTRQVIEYS